MKATFSPNTAFRSSATASASLAMSATCLNLNHIWCSFRGTGGAGPSLQPLSPKHRRALLDEGEGRLAEVGRGRELEVPLGLQLEVFLIGHALSDEVVRLHGAKGRGRL